jgi:hypothetical protein
MKHGDVMCILVNLYISRTFHTSQSYPHPTRSTIYQLGFTPLWSPSAGRGSPSPPRRKQSCTAARKEKKRVRGKSGCMVRRMYGETKQRQETCQTTGTHLLLSILILVSLARKTDSKPLGHVLHTVGPDGLVQRRVNAHITERG